MTDPDDPSDEYLGLASGFVFAGCPVVLSTLWTVTDDAALMLSARFYQELRAHHRPSTALAPVSRPPGNRHPIPSDHRPQPARGRPRAHRQGGSTALQKGTDPPHRQTVRRPGVLGTIRDRRRRRLPASLIPPTTTAQR